MFRKLPFTVALLVFACGGSLSDEQRKQLREAREQQAIMKVSEADLLSAAFQTGRRLLGSFKSQIPDAQIIDSIGKANQVSIQWQELSAGNAREIERQLIDAYLEALSQGKSLTDNVQRVGRDTLLYTKPVVVYRPDSVLEIKGMWSIRMPTRQVVLGMARK